MVGLAALALLSGCAGYSNINEYGDDLKANFVFNCTTEVRSENGTTTTAKLASENYCECVYDELPDSGLSVEELKDYEAEVAAAAEGDDPPALPDEIRRAMDKCEGRR